MQELIDCLLAGNEKVSLRERLVFRFDTVGKLRYIIDLENLVGNRRFSHVRECLEYVKEYFAALHPREHVTPEIDYENLYFKKLYHECMDACYKITGKLESSQAQCDLLRSEKEFLKENNTKFAKSHAKMVCDNFNLEAKADKLETTLKEEEKKSEYWMGQYVKSEKEFDACKVRYYELAGLNEELKTKLKMHEQRVFKGCP